MSAGFLANPDGSLGDLCLGGVIGRFISAIQVSGASGVISVTLDPAALPQPTGLESAVDGLQGRTTIEPSDDAVQRARVK